MRTFSWVLILTACLVGRADADAGKAWSAAKDSLPANTEFIAGVDVAAAVKTAAFASLLDFVRAEERDFERGHMMIKGACGFDPLTVVDGFVVAGSTQGEKAVFFLQLSIDRQKASACLETTLKLVLGVKGGKPITVKQDGIYTVAGDGGGKKALYFAWVGPNVVAFTINPDNKAELGGWIGGNKAFAKAAVAAAADKLDLKAAAFGAYASVSGNTFGMPVSKAVATAYLANGKLSGSFSMSTPDAKIASVMATDMKKEIDRDMKKDRTPAAVKKVFAAISIQPKNDTVTVSGTIAEKDLAAAITELAKKQKKTGGSAGSDAAQAVAKMEEFSKKMCSCKDKACADKVNEELTKWGTEMAKNAGKDDAPDHDLARKAADVMTRYTECMTKLMMGPGNRP